MTASLAQKEVAFSGPMCGDIDIRIARDGTWFHEGGPIGRKELVCLFASVLKRDEFGDYWLETPVEKARIQVEDAPFVVLQTIVGLNRSCPCAQMWMKLFLLGWTIRSE
ncbi:DUF1285 domain-containing protein [Terasakiella sp. SH-1]|uniref:DUF1285 domain-containing protein n=1 Tax=Terasakiella sp. SH-1 TaxID=2560057 RepID=UPI00320B1A48